MKQLLKNMYVKNQKVILRCDLNVPIINNSIIDETKIIKSLETINYLLNQNCAVIIITHLGRIKNEQDKELYTLNPIKLALEKHLGMPIKYAKNIISEETKTLAQNLQPKEILLLENIRFIDIPNKLESNLNEDTAQYLASLGEIFVFDAFAVAHRKHTSVVGIAKYLPNCLGFLAEKELNMLDETITMPNHPFTVIMGGAKVDDKLQIIKSLLPKCDHLLLSGGIANSFLSALNLNVGASLKTTNPQIINELKNIMLTYKSKLALPLDAIVKSTYNNNPTLKNINKLDINDIICDIGIKTITKYGNIINESQTIFINGTMGIYEEKAFANGTTEIFNLLKNNKGKVVIGGGDTISALNNLGFKDQFLYISSGGGATLEYLANSHLPGIDAISEGDNVEILDM